MDPSGHRRWSGILGCGALLATLILSACSERTSLPLEIQGRYETSDAEYADRSFTLTSDRFILELGKHGTETHPVQQVKLESQPDGSELYTVVYLNQHMQEYKVTFSRRPTDRDTLVMANLPRVVWTRSEATP